jgi:capsular polysaccharide biosynthesis protein
MNKQQGLFTVLKKDNETTITSYVLNDFVIYNQPTKNDREKNSIEFINNLNNYFQWSLKYNAPNQSAIFDNNTIYKTNGYIYMNQIILTDVIYRHLKPNTKIYQFPIAFTVNNPWGANFYHFLVEKLYYVMELSKIDQNIPIILSYNSNVISDILSFLKIPNPIIVRDENILYKVENLIFMNSPTFGPICGPNLQYLRKNILENLESEPNNNENIAVIIKRNSSQRSIHNFDELYSELTKQLPNYKWIIYENEKSFEKTAKIFNSAKLIIGTYGAALTNIICCREDTIVFEFVPENFLGICYKEIAEYCNIKNFYSLILNDDGIKNSSNMNVPVSDIISTIKQYI